MRFFLVIVLALCSFLPSFAQSIETNSALDSNLTQSANSPSFLGGVGGGPSIKVLTWNIYMLPHFISYTGQFRRAKAIGQLLKTEDYDIVLFQEAFGKTSRRKLRKALAGMYPHEIQPRNHKKTVNNGLWILSKHEIKNAQFFFFDNCLVSDCQSAKGAVLIEVDINGQTYQFVNTHTQAEDGKEFANVRTGQLKKIANLLLTHQKPKVPQFILGDLNTAKQVEEEYQTMLTTLNATDGAVATSDATELSVDRPITWGCANNDLIKNKWKGQVQLLDYALQRNTNYPFKLRRELKTYTQQWSKKRKHLSDHYAISLTILP